MPRESESGHARASRRIVQQGNDIRSRINRLARGAMAGNMAEVREVVSSTLHGVKEELASVLPEKRESVLRQVVDGLGDAIEAGSDAVKEAVDHAAKRGERLRKTDLKAISKELRGIEESFVDTVKESASTLERHARLEARDVAAIAKKAAKRIAPAARSAADALDGHVVDAAKEAASTAGKAARVLAGSAAEGVAGVLKKAGKSLKKGAATNKAAKKTTTKSSAKKASKKSVARRSTKKTTTKKAAKKSTSRKAAKKTTKKKSR
ncbi:MAG: DUF6781 family protein [Phycisphaerales bacterium]|nr:MAG: hypothetical protein IPK69_10450 [Phycisphaerales bacterium]